MDLAERGEVLLTVAAHDALDKPDEWQFEDYAATVSGLDVTAFKLVR